MSGKGDSFRAGGITFSTLDVSLTPTRTTIPKLRPNVWTVSDIHVCLKGGGGAVYKKLFCRKTPKKKGAENPMWCSGWSLLSWRSYFHGVSHDPLPSTPAREKSVAVSMATRSAVRVVGWLPEVVVVGLGGGGCCWSCTVSVVLFLNMAEMRWGLQAQPGL